MKFLLIITGLLFSSLGFSQSDIVKKDLKKYTELYNLSNSQVPQVKDLLIKKEKDLSDIINSDDEGKVKYVKRQDLMKEYDKKFVALLNEEQKLAHEKIKLINEAVRREHKNSGAELDPSKIKGAPKDAGKKASSI